MPKQQIRKQVFETNSSSSHSISIGDINDDFVMDLTLIPDHNGNIILTGGEFGREWSKYNDATTKVNYLMVSVGSNSIEGNKEKQELLKTVIKEQTGCNKVIFRPHQESYSDSVTFGYVDHQSAKLHNVVFNSQEDLRNFIFNKNSWLFTGNDESTSPELFYDVEKYKENGEIIIPSHKYELTIQHIDEIYKFVERPDYDLLESVISDRVCDLEFYEDGTIKEKSRYRIYTPSDKPYYKFDWSSNNISKDKINFVSSLLEIDARKLVTSKIAHYEATRILLNEYPEKYTKSISYQLIEVQ